MFKDGPKEKKHFYSRIVEVKCCLENKLWNLTELLPDFICIFFYCFFLNSKALVLERVLEVLQPSEQWHCKM